MINSQYQNFDYIWEGREGFKNGEEREERERENT
jgi:hypothetical protein